MKKRAIPPPLGSADLPEHGLLHRDAIVCPECDSVEVADVVQVEGHRWPSFVHTCSACDHTITISEWTTADDHIQELRTKGEEETRARVSAQIALAYARRAIRMMMDATNDASLHDTAWNAGWAVIEDSGHNNEHWDAFVAQLTSRGEEQSK